MDAKTQQVTFIIPAKTYEALKREAKAEGRSISNYIAKIVDSRAKVKP
jgi:hypothetical protein